MRRSLLSLCPCGCALLDASAAWTDSRKPKQPLRSWLASFCRFSLPGTIAASVIDIVAESIGKRSGIPLRGKIKQNVVGKYGCSTAKPP